MTWKICIGGLVQGVGFRPFVWRAALDKNLKGSVANGLEGVVIRMNGTEQQAIDFQDFIQKNAPETARITRCSIAHDTEQFFDSFTIEESDNVGSPVLLLTPDVALCAECRREIHDPANRRYRYAFTTCTVCGPRYSILAGVPYDRPTTTMHRFDMCRACAAEYHNPTDRRFFAQTNSCKDCGIRLQFFDCATSRFANDDHQGQILQTVVEAWNNGAVVAVKGIGGYLLTCDAGNPVSIAALRARKHRPTKPFALMYPDLESLQHDAVVATTEAELLQSSAAPIVLLTLQEAGFSGIDKEGIAPGLHKIGAMLPNAPLFDLLLRDFGRPIVATSGNLSNAPLVCENEKAIRELSGIADYVLLHDRDIAMPQDDSVVAVCPHSRQTVVIRRARGLAPTFIQPDLYVPKATVLALGAEMKATVTLAHLSNVNISQYLGDLSDFAVQERFQQALQHLMRIFDASPSVIVSDLHPGYFTSQQGQTLAEQWRIPHTKVQHHEAHFAAVLAENNLFKDAGAPVLGIVWDGTGLGTDGQIWGGEFFTYSNTLPGVIVRCAHFDYFPLMLGDKMPREPRISALATCFNHAPAANILRPKFTDKEWMLYQKLPLQPGQLMTSSVGRIFDAVASLLGLADKVSYEGEAAMLLEDLARQYCNRHGLDLETDYSEETVSTVGALEIKTANLFEQIIADINDGKPVEFIAAKFHYSMVKIIQKVSKQLEINKIAFSGGVFQNTLLLDMLQHQLSPDFELFFHRQLSPNDENISFGQWAHYTLLQQRQ